MSLGNLSYHRMLWVGKKRGKYTMMSEIYLFQFSKKKKKGKKKRKAFCGKIKLTK